MLSTQPVADQHVILFRSDYRSLPADCSTPVLMNNHFRNTRRLIMLGAVPGKSTTGSKQGKITGRR